MAFHLRYLWLCGLGRAVNFTSTVPPFLGVKIFYFLYFKSQTCIHIWDLWIKFVFKRYQGKAKKLVSPWEFFISSPIKDGCTVWVLSARKPLNQKSSSVFVFRKQRSTSNQQMSMQYCQEIQINSNLNHKLTSRKDTEIPYWEIKDLLRNRDSVLRLYCGLVQNCFPD